MLANLRERFYATKEVVNNYISEKLHINNRGNIVMNILVPGAIAVAVVGILASISAKTTNDVATSLPTGTAKDAALNATTGLGNLASYLPIVGTVLAIGAVIGVLLYSFAYFKQR